MAERTYVNEYYNDPQEFLDQLNSINVRKLTTESDKNLIRKLKKWVKEYWGDDGKDYKLFESQYARLQIMIRDADLTK